jgi:uncharacterized protein
LNHDDLASVVFNRYLDMSGDVEGLSALPFFLSLRAAIRAHVTAASALKRTSLADAQLEYEEAQTFLELAQHFLTPVTPLLIAIGGLSGSGKSSLANRIAQDFQPVPGARVIRSDVLRKRSLGQVPEQRLPSSAYSNEAKCRVYSAMFQEAAKTLDAGYTAILDATFLDPRQRTTVESLMRGLNIKFIGVWLYAAPELLKKRVAARRGDASDADLRILAEQLRIEPGVIDWHRIDVSGDHAVCVEMLHRVLFEFGSTANRLDTKTTTQ